MERSPVKLSFQNLVTEKESKAIPGDAAVPPEAPPGLGKATPTSWALPLDISFLQSLGFGKNLASRQLASKLLLGRGVWEGLHTSGRESLPHMHARVVLTPAGL